MGTFERLNAGETISLSFFFPAILSMVILYVLVLFIQQEGQSVSIMYIFSLFIAGGYFFIAAAIIYLTRKFTKSLRARDDEIDHLKTQLDTYKNLKKKFEQQYYKREIDEETFKLHMRNCEEKIAYFTAELESAQKEKYK